MIWSAEADTLPWMWGKATLAMVVSSAFITVAVITDATMNGLAEPTPAGSFAVLTSLALRMKKRIGATDGGRCIRHIANDFSQLFVTLNQLPQL